MAGVPLSSIIDCRLRHSVVGCDDVVVGVVVGDGKAQLVLLPVERVCDRTKSLSRCTVPRLRWRWKRGPLAPVVVGEGQVNLVSSRLRSRLVPW